MAGDPRSGGGGAAPESGQLCVGEGGSLRDGRDVKAEELASWRAKLGMDVTVESCSVS